LKRINREEKHLFQFASIRIDVEKMEVVKDSKLIAMTPAEFHILALLCTRPRRVFSREELIHCISDEQYEGYDRTVDVHIKNIRRKLDDDPKNPVYIHTVYGMGYKFQVENR
jgi:DNA-binding response OmpR family regulator